MRCIIGSKIGVDKRGICEDYDNLSETIEFISKRIRVSVMMMMIIIIIAMMMVMMMIVNESVSFSTSTFLF